MTGRVAAFVRLSRPVFLLGGALLYALGAMIAAGEWHAIDWGRYSLGQALVTAVQLTTQYGNEYFDLEADRATTRRTWLSGGSGVLPSGALSPTVALRAATVTAAAAITLTGIVAFIEPIAAVVAIVALAGGWWYSAPPARLVGSGWGEVAASAIVAVLTPVTGALLQGRLSTAVWAAAAGLFAVHFAMLLALQLPDASSDGSSGKRTLAVRVGQRRVTTLHDAALAVAFAWFAAAATASWIEGAAFSGIAVPAAAVQVAAAHGHRYRLLTTAAVATFALLAAALLVAAG